MPSYPHTQSKPRPKKRRGKEKAAFTIALIPSGGGFKKEWRISLAGLRYISLLLLLLFSFIVFSLFQKYQLEQERLRTNDEAQAWLARWEILENGKERITQNLNDLQKVGEKYYRTIFQTIPDLGDRALADTIQKQNAKLLPLMSVMRLITAREDAYIHMPLGIAVRSNQITSLFGSRPDPFGLETSFHTGIDFAAGIGAPIHATADGIVQSTNDEGTSGLGINVRIEHKHGFITVYAHMSQIAVSKGQHLRRGDLVGFVGMTGRVTGPHLHYEVHVKNTDPNNYLERYYNPMPFIREKL